MIGTAEDIQQAGCEVWEQRRYELAREIFLCAISHFPQTSMAEDVENAVFWADCLISELRKKKES